MNNSAFLEEKLELSYFQSGEGLPKECEIEFYVKSSAQQSRNSEQIHKQRIEITFPLYQANWSRFAKVLVIHLLYCFLLGPFIQILSPLIGKHFLKNLGLLNRNWQGIGLLIWYVFYIGVFVVFLPDILNPNMNPWDYRVFFEIFPFIGFIFCVCVILSSKYLLISKVFLELMETQNLEDIELKLGHGYASLSKLKPQINNDFLLEKDLQENIFALKVDASFLYFEACQEFSYTEKDLQPFRKREEYSLMKNLKVDNDYLSSTQRALPLVEGVSVIHGHFEDMYLSQNTRYDNLKFSGYELALKMIKDAVKTSVPFDKFVQIICLLSALAVPIFCLWALYRNSDYQSFQVSIFLVQLFFYSLLTVILFYCYRFLNQVFLKAIKNLQERIILLQNLENLLSDDDSDNNYPKFCIFDPMSLRTWSSLRKVFMRHGDSLITRTSLCITFILGFCIFILTLFLLNKIGLISFLDFFLNHSASIIVIVAGQCIPSLTIALVLLWYGWLLNKQYHTHQVKIRATKTRVQDLLRFIETCIGKDAIQPKDHFLKDGINFISQRFVGKPIQELDDETIRKIESHINILAGTLDEITEELQEEEKYNSFKIMGISVSNTLIKSVAISLIPVFIAIIQKISLAFKS